jgi:hypothetical protein
MGGSASRHRHTEARTTTAIGESGHRSACSLRRWSPVKLTPRPARSRIVLDHQPRGDALHPYLAFFSAVALVGEGDPIVLRRDPRLEVAAMKITRGRKGHSAFDVQLTSALTTSRRKSRGATRGSGPRAVGMIAFCRLHNHLANGAKSLYGCLGRILND